jgi:hypothetical protein
LRQHTCPRLPQIDARVLQNPGKIENFAIGVLARHLQHSRVGENYDRRRTPASA